MSLRSLTASCLLLCAVGTVFAFPSGQIPLLGVPEHNSGKNAAESGLCPQATPLYPSKGAGFDAFLDRLYKQEFFQLEAFEALGRAVRVPTESYDGLGPVGVDPRWDTFAELHSTLEDVFPNVFASLQVTKVNTYALVFHWQGTDKSKLPVLLTGHQDVVPVEPSTVDQWLQPPYSGYYDGTWIWGRGSVDDKSTVVSLLVTIDSLLNAGFKPSRTFVFAFGIDEEASGRQGAGHLAKYLEETYGRDGFAALLDEGGGFGYLFGEDVLYAVPCTAEKGYLDVRVEVSTLGGHSSMPPPHTGIGILASAIVAIEDKPHSVSLDRDGTVLETLECIASHSAGFPQSLKDLILKAREDDDALESLNELLPASDPRYRAILGTTQAVDLIQGGVKVNALPERVDAVVNHRIAEQSSVRDVQEHITRVLIPIAEAFNLTLDAFGKNVTAGSGQGGHIALSDAWGTSLEPAPKTPTDNDGPWGILSGSIQAAVYQSSTNKGKTTIVTPTLATGNTDTRYYWNLTRHIYRYSHVSEAGVYNGAHTVNEALSGDALIQVIEFHTKFILNWDESSL